jgi:two-component system response regulator YesN
MSLTDAARGIQISKSKLKSLFATQLNTSFSKYLQDLRMEKAEELLRTSDQFIIDVALKVGFTDPKYFSRVFKKKHGMTPQEYRDKNFTP